MKLTQLSEMLAIVEQGSLRAAARRLGVPQPALTRSIRALEKELGIALFERDASGMSLTALGKLFHGRAGAIVHEVQKARDEIAQARGEDRGTVIVGMSIMPHVHMLPKALPAFRTRYPNVRLQIIEGLFPDIESRLRDGTIDLYIGAAPRARPSPGLIIQLLFENTRAVVGRKGHPLRHARSLSDLASAQWATTSIDYNAETDLQELFAHYGMAPPTLALQVRSAMSLMVGLAYTDLLALLPIQWKDFPLTQHVLEVIPVLEPLPAPSIVLMRRPDLPLTPAAEHFTDLLLRHVPQSADPIGEAAALL
jgi:LysR family transcriptional regulator of abg operon